MRRGGLIGLGLCAGIVLLTLYVLLTPNGERLSATESNAWASGATVEDLGLISGLNNAGNLECQYMNLKSRYVYSASLIGGKTVFNNQTTEGEGKTYPETCVTQNKHGLMSSTGLWSKDLNPNNAMPIDSSRYSMMPSPGGTAVVFYDIAPTYGYQYSINHNINYIGSISTKKYGSGVSARYEKIWKIDTGKMDNFLIYGTPENGTIARFDQIGFSSNGRYAVVLLSRRGFARLDLYTKQLTPFYNVNYNNGVGVYMTISNDGRYVATSKVQSSSFLMHDLAGCQSTFEYGAWPATGTLPTAGCQSSNIFNSVQSKFSTVSTVGCLRFAPNGGSVNACATYAGGGGSLSNKIRLDANNYLSSARGYLAMGDSFSSGEGDLDGGNWYEPETDEQGDINSFFERNLCHLSRRSYPYLMAIELGYLDTNVQTPSITGDFHSAACSGAKMHNITGLIGEKHDDGTASDFAITDNQYRYNRDFFMGIFQPGVTAQLSFVRENNFTPTNSLRPKQNPEIITLGIGGNDAGFGDKLKSCLLPGTCEFATSEDKRAEMIIELAGEKERLEQVYKTVKRDAPDARIYIVGYPQFVTYPITTCASNVHLDEQEVKFMHESVIYFNDVVKAAASSAGVYYVNIEDSLIGVNLCSSASDQQMSFNGATAGNDIAISPVDSGMFRYGLCVIRNCIGNESFHPNQKGHEKFSLEILDKTNDLSAQMPEPRQTSIPTPQEYFGVGARSYVEALNDPLTPEQTRSQFVEMVTGAIDYHHPTIKLEGLMPNSSVNFEIHSSPVSLGNFTVNPDGTLVTNLLLPEGTEPGYHEIHVYGFDTFGSPIDYYEPIILGSLLDDFDSDEIPDDQDSCPTIFNSFVDIDEDGIDDACDNLAVLTEQTPETPPQEPADAENPYEEPANEETPPEEEPQDNEPAEYVDKGTPSLETVAGNKQTVQSTGVLGASTTVQTSTATLQSTGKVSATNILFGLAIILTTTSVGLISKKIS